MCPLLGTSKNSAKRHPSCPQIFPIGDKGYRSMAYVMGDRTPSPKPPSRWGFSMCPRLIYHLTHARGYLEKPVSLVFRGTLRDLSIGVGG